MCNGIGRELGAIVGSDVIRWAMFDEQISQGVKHPVWVKPAVHDDGQTAPGELVDDGEHPEGLAVMGPVHDEVVRPDIIGPTGVRTNSGPIIEP